MKVTVKKRTEVAIDFVRIQVAVNYGEEDITNDFPFRRGDVWDVVVDINTGRILDWPSGVECDLHMKVCDQGSYWLLDRDRGVIASIEQNYVPHGVVPGSYGDYVELTINGDGIITNWPQNPDVSEFCAADD